MLCLSRPMMLKDFASLSDGKVLIGHTSNIFSYKLAVFGTDGGNSGISASRFSNNPSPSSLILSKSRGTSIGSYTIVQNNDEVGMIDFRGADGTDNMSKVAEIQASIDGTPGSNDMPGRLTFHTTADGANSTTERLRITSTGRTSIGANNQSYGRLQVNQTSDHDEAGFAGLNSGGSRSLRIYCDSSNNAVFNSGNAGTGQINFNEGKVIINSSGHVVPGADSTYDLGLTGTRFRNVYADTYYGDGSNLSNITSTTINNNADNRVITGSGTANTLNAESGLLWDSTRLTISGSTNQKIILQGATHPYIHFYEGTTGKAFIQWHADGYLRIKNDEDNATIRLKDSIQFSTDDSTFYTMWHAGNDGSGSGLEC